MRHPLRLGSLLSRDKIEREKTRDNEMFALHQEDYCKVKSRKVSIKGRGNRPTGTSREIDKRRRGWRNWGVGMGTKQRGRKGPLSSRVGRREFEKGAKGEKRPVSPGPTNRKKRKLC